LEQFRLSHRALMLARLWTARRSRSAILRTTVASEGDGEVTTQLEMRVGWYVFGFRGVLASFAIPVSFDRSCGHFRQVIH